MRQSQLRRLYGALRSRHKAAYLGLGVQIAKPITKRADRIATLQYSKERIASQLPDPIPPCLMIVSPPRSGSTIIYQVLVKTIQCVYISNLHALFPRNASGYMLQRGRFGEGKANLQNYYGYTSSLYDVNEGNDIIESIIVDNADVATIRDRFLIQMGFMLARADRPFIFKNVSAYEQITTLHSAVPELTFLRIRRDPERVIQSVIRAYRELGTFNPIPRELRLKKIDDPIEFAVRQILAIEKSIDAQLADIENSKWLEWSYEEFCEKSETLIQDLAGEHLCMSNSRPRFERSSVVLQTSRRIHVSKKEADQISALVKRFN